MTGYLKEIMAKIDFPEEAVQFLLNEWEEIKDGPVGRALLLGREKYINEEKLDYNAVIKNISEICGENGRNRYPAHMLFFLIISKDLKKRYEKLGIDEEIYYDSMRDLKWKLLECYETDGVWGISVAWWEPGFFVPDRFTLGRLQFELFKFGHDYTGHGFTLTPDSTVINMHIPSSGPMTPELCMDSFKRAHEFYRDQFPSGISIFMVESWLLFPKHREFLPANSNILKFMDFFEIIKSSEEKPGKRGDMWRIFGKHAKALAEELPRDTGLRRAYADWLQKGGTVGGGDGIFFFDGEKILK